MAQGKRQFRNTTKGYVGVTTLTRRGEEKAIAVEPGAAVFLSDEEIELTRDAPTYPQDNPFAAHPFVEKDPSTDEVLEEGSRPLLEEVHTSRESPRPLTQDRRVRQTPGEVGATNLSPKLKAPVGSFASGEETGT